MSFFGSAPQSGNALTTTPTSGGSFFGGFSSTGSAITTAKEQGSALLPGQGGIGFGEQGFVSSSDDADNNTADNSLSGYHFVEVTPNTQYTITANRLETDLDPAMWVFAQFNTFEEFLASGTLDSNDVFSSSTLNYLAYGDDEVSHPGPFGDPQVTITSPDSGRLTIVVTNFASGSNDGGDGRFDYELSFSPDDAIYHMVEGGLLAMNFGNSLFGAPSDTGGSLFGDAADAGQPFNGTPPDLASSMFTYKASSGVLIFDNVQHSSDGGGQPIDGRGTGDEAANVYREFDALGINVSATAATDGNTLAQLLAGVAAFVLPENEGGNVFPDADTVFHFVDDGGNLLVFGGNGTNSPNNAPQLDFLNDTFGLELTGQYDASGVYPLSPGALAEFLADGGPAQLGSNNGTSYLDMDSLPDDAVVIYGREADAETVLAFLPTGEGQLVFLGWDYFESFDQDNGWDAAFEIVAELTTEVQVSGVADTSVGNPFWGFGA